MNADLLIDRLAADCAPVQCLRCPMRRAATWLALAVPYVAAVVMLSSSQVDLALVIADWRFIAEQVATIVTAITAAFAAFAATVPGTDRRILLLPILPFLAWLATLGAGGAEEWMRDGIAGLAAGAEWFCVKWIVTIGAVPALIMAFMLRKGAPMAPYVTAALGGLAAAALGNLGLRLQHVEDVSVLMVVWHVGTVIAFSALAGWAGRMWMGWRPRLTALRKRVACG